MDFKAQILQATDIVAVIGRTVALKQRGRKYLGLCPFHQEKTPSFNVDQPKQFFHCFGCKASGNVIDFVMRRDRIAFVDAMKLLGDEAGLEMPKFGVSKQKTGERQSLLEMQSAACAFFEKSLWDEHGRPARQYLASRGFTDEALRNFQVGLAPDSWDALLTSAVGRKYGGPALLSAGLVKAREKGSGHYDTFRNRIIFPIRDENGRVIAFGGRAMPGSPDPAKYLNSPETPLFSKSRSVYGLDLARQRIVETRTAVVVEGYTDVLMSHQFGVRNVISPLGTAMTEQHVSVLRRFADRIVLLFDADVAGEKAVDKAVALFLTQPVEIAIASMPDGVDPDEFLMKQGAEAFNAVVDGAADALSYKWKQLHSAYLSRGDDLTGRQEAVSNYLDLLASARGSGPVDPIRWGLALSRVSRLTGIPVDDLNNRFRMKPEARRAAPAGRVETEMEPASRSGPVRADERAARWALGVLLTEPGRWETVQYKVRPDDFNGDRHRRLAEMYWNHQRDEGEPVFSEFLGVLQDPSLVELAIECVEEIEELKDLDATLDGAVDHLVRLRRQREEGEKLIVESERTSDAGPSEQDEILYFKKLQEKARQPDLRRF